MKTNLLKFVMGMLLPVTLVFTSCSDDDPKSSLTGITEFGFLAESNIPGLENIEFTIDQVNLTITNANELPYMADVSALVADFKAIDKTIVKVGTTIQESGVTPNDFSSPVNYVVTAEDGVTQLTYQVIVKVSQVNPEGVSWVKENPGISDMAYNCMQALYFNGKHLAVFSEGGFSSTTKLFKSNDGKAWSEVTLDTNFPGGSAGAYYTLASHNDKLYVCGYAALAGGWAPEDIAEVWESTDGENYTKLDNSYSKAAVTPATFSINNTLWVVGGQTTFYGSISGTKGIDSDFFGPQSLSNQIRSTSDLTTWDESSVLPEEAPRRWSANVVHNGKMYMIGGQLQGGFLSDDVWSSSDGVNWTKTTPTGMTARMGAAAISYDGKIWLFGGQTELGVCTNDVLVSTDGASWTTPDEDAVLPAEFAGRAGHSAYIDADHKVWIVGGYKAELKSTTDPDSGDVTYSEEITKTTEVWSGKLNKL